MGRWTELRKLSDKDFWYDDGFDYDGPACYELAIAGPRGGQPQIVYVGETGNERARLSCYARNGSHLSAIIDWHLVRGWSLYYRGYALSSKEEAKRMQDSRLSEFFYPWNSAQASLGQ
jgi:hypothetical protein